MKQSHLAELLFVNQTTVSRWERGEIALPRPVWVSAQRILGARPDPQQDAALKRLVETSAQKVHLICDRTHLLLAASPSRTREWRADPNDFYGTSLIYYASDEILAAEDTLHDCGWHAGAVSAMAVDTGANDDPVFHILPGRMLWERLQLSDGSPARLVTTLA